MTNYWHRHIKAGALVALALTITACSKSGDPTPTPSPTATVTVRQEDQFGMAFANSFRAENNSEPYSPQDGDITAISLTTEPVNIN